MPVNNLVSNPPTSDSPQPVHNFFPASAQGCSQPPTDPVAPRLLTPEEKLAELAFWVARGTFARLDGKVLRESPFRTAHLSPFGSACADAWRQGWQAKDDSLAGEDRRLRAQRREALRSQSGTTRAPRPQAKAKSAARPARRHTPQPQPAKRPRQPRQPHAKGSS